MSDCNNTENKKLYPEGLSPEDKKVFKTMDALEKTSDLAIFFSDVLGLPITKRARLINQLTEIKKGVPCVSNSDKEDVFYFSRDPLTVEEKQALLDVIGKEVEIRELRYYFDEGIAEEGTFFLILTVLGGGTIAYSDRVLDPFWQELLYRAKNVLQRKMELKEYDERTGIGEYAFVEWKVIKKNGIFAEEKE